MIQRELQGMETVSLSHSHMRRMTVALSDRQHQRYPPKCHRKESYDASPVAFSRENVGDFRTSHAHPLKSRQSRTTGWPAARRENQGLTDKQIVQARHEDEHKQTQRDGNKREKWDSNRIDNVHRANLSICAASHQPDGRTVHRTIYISQKSFTLYAAEQQSVQQVHGMRQT